jgi:hypothetical protein
MSLPSRLHAMNPISRRDILAVGASGGLLAATSAAMGQTSPQVLQPNRAPAFGGSIPGPRDLTRDRENPDMLNPPSTDQGTLPNLVLSPVVLALTLWLWVQAELCADDPDADTPGEKSISAIASGRALAGFKANRPLVPWRPRILVCTENLNP